MSKRVLVLLSGGLDSLTCLAHYVARPDVEHVEALTYFYNQSSATEVKRAQQVCADWCVPHVVQSLQVAATDTHAEIPARNLVFIAHAMAYALQHELDTVCIGAEPDATYTDSSAEFVAAMDTAVKLFGVRLEAPIKTLENKAEVLRVALGLGVPLHLCHSSLSEHVDGQCKTSARFLAAINTVFPCGYTPEDILRLLGRLRTIRGARSYRVGYGDGQSFKLAAAVFTLAQCTDAMGAGATVYSTGSWMAAMQDANLNRVPAMPLRYSRTEVLTRLLHQTFNCDSEPAQLGIMQALSGLPRPRYAPRLACRVVQGHLAAAARRLGYAVVTPREPHDILLDTSTRPVDAPVPAWDE
jgi:7-cyano-7-deazaguanine synthase in queuosine biosynthesis